jgi:hypothetical protein
MGSTSNLIFWSVEKFERFNIVFCECDVSERIFCTDHPKPVLSQLIYHDTKRYDVRYLGMVRMNGSS